MIQKIRSTEELKRAIFALEQRQMNEGRLLKGQFFIVSESLNPVNVLRNMINEWAAPSELKDSLFQTAIGLIAGYLSRKVVVRSSKNPLLRFAGLFVEFGIINLVSHYSEAIRKAGSNLIRNLAGSVQKR